MVISTRLEGVIGLQAHFFMLGDVLGPREYRGMMLTRHRCFSTWKIGLEYLSRRLDWICFVELINAQLNRLGFITS